MPIEMYSGHLVCTSFKERLIAIWGSIMPFRSNRKQVLLFGLLVFVSAEQALSSAPSQGDDARAIVDVLKYDSLEQMRVAGLEKAQLPSQPWSGWYWPFNQGALAYRYADPKFPKSTAWDPIYRYLLASLGAVSASELSPSEKYDLLVGDSGLTLSRNMLLLASNRVDNGSIPAWLGYCGGWANAAMNLPKPAHPVLVTARDGVTQIEFEPADIEALATLLWANGTVPYRMAGTLCHQIRIETDSNGRAIDPSCRDNNPATWHLSVVNQIGFSHRGLIIDADPAYQIWNHPVFSYSYSYFNPATGNSATSLEEAKVGLSSFAKDRFAPYRGQNAMSVVGIEMQTTFMYFKVPGSSSPTEDNETRTAAYRYDLELDSSERIVGGEWYSYLHPDVIWVAPPGASPITVADAQLEGAPNWTRGQPLPESWKNAAVIAAGVAQPLSKIVDRLMLWSNE